MYLKRLELNGFKTFADHTTLEFGPGITGIVGPNGSGKSNIADAIVWSLGEQSMKSLRSARAADVVFAGSPSRRRAGVGEVSLTLDNADGSLPLDFSEITITRRVFRTGEGEYFINRVPCRLRDIHELLLDTGIGKHAYSVISQTEIDRILSVRSEDRREIFEQAAGVQRYRQRKTEATRKLDRVCANLLRVNDIIHELEAQVAPLAEQSEAAREYKTVSKELFDLKLSLLVNEHAALSENLTRARDRGAELEREIEATRTRSHQLAAEEVEARAQLQRLEERLEETRDLVARLAGEADRADSRVTLNEQRIEDLRGQQERAKEELAKLEQQRAAAEAELAAAEKERPELARRAEELRAEIEERGRHLKEETGSVQSTGQSVEEQRAAHLDTLRELADARNQLVQCESLQQAARARIARLTEQRAEIEGRRKVAEGRATEATRAAEKLRGQRESLLGEVYSLRSEEEAAEGKIDELRGGELKLRERLSAVSSRLRALQEMEQSREGLRAGTRAVLKAVKEGRLKGRYRTVADLLRVPKELEAAVEAALGPAAGDLVVGTQEEAAEAIAFLKRANAGRATFLPTSTLKPWRRSEDLSEVARRPGCLGIAADLVSCEAEAQPIVEHLLGRVVVVEALAATLELSRSTKGWRAIVTREGDLVRPWGAITGGSRPARSGLIGRAREIEDLEKEGRELKAGSERAAAELAQVEARAEAARAAVREREAGLEQVTKELTEAERGAEVLAENARLAAEREESLGGEQGELEEEVAQIAQEQTTAAARVGELEGRKQAMERAMAQSEKALEQGRETREDLRASTSELRVNLTAMEGDLRALEARLEKIRQSRGVLESGREDKRALMERIAEAQRQTEAGLETLRAEGERLRGRHQEAQKELEQCHGQRRELLERIATNREGAAQNRAEAEGLQNRLHRLELRTTQLDSEISFGERTLLEDYRLTLEQAEHAAQPIESRTAAKQRVKELQGRVDELGEVNLGAIEEYDRVRERLEFLAGQRSDLEAAREDVRQAIIEIDREATSRFLAAFESIQQAFQKYFIRLFDGGQAELTLTDTENVLDCGINVTVTVPGKKTRDLLQLSGGERALTAAAILFSLLKVKPSPFVILDEVDAPLDDSNIGRYSEVLREFARDSQFIVITHNKGTMEAADILYGTTMEKAGVSKLIGMRLRDPEEHEARPPTPEGQAAEAQAEEARKEVKASSQDEVEKAA